MYPWPQKRFRGLKIFNHMQHTLTVCLPNVPTSKSSVSFHIYNEVNVFRCKVCAVIPDKLNFAPVIWPRVRQGTPTSRSTHCHSEARRGVPPVAIRPALEIQCATATDMRESSHWWRRGSLASLGWLFLRNCKLLTLNPNWYLFSLCYTWF